MTQNTTEQVKLKGLNLVNNLENITIIKASAKNLEDIEKIESNLSIRNLSYSSLLSDLNLDSTIYFIAFKNDLPIGYIGAEMLYDHADITAVTVDLDYRNKNIATLLLNKLIDTCKAQNFTAIFLEVRVSNLPAIRLYEKFGFKKINIRPNYYQNEDAYIYKKDLA